MTDDADVGAALNKICLVHICRISAHLQQQEGDGWHNSGLAEAGLCPFVNDRLAQFREVEKLECMLAVEVQHSEVIRLMQIVSHHCEVAGITLLGHIERKFRMPRICVCP